MLIYLTGWWGRRRIQLLCQYTVNTELFCKDKDLKSQTEQIQLKKVTKEIVTNVPHP